MVAGIILLYTLMEFLKDFVHFCFLASGAAMRPIHDTPIAARSLRDFWGKRWNRPVSAWLYRLIFLPLARQHRPCLGLFCACLASGVLHAWVALVALGACAAFEVAVFFCLQGVLILAEDRLHVHAWPVTLARVWTLAVLLATSPLVICPYLRIFHL
jgi:D-alanyl-lipoteichoic acid acyltransferase DltB (MBOAT superfamily)